MRQALTPADILAMPDAELKTLIEAEIKGKKKPHSDETSAALRAPEVLDRVYYMVIRILQNTDGQLAAMNQDLDVRKAQLLGQGRSDRQYLQARAEIAANKASALRFRSALSVFLQDIKYLRSAQRDDNAEDRAAYEAARLANRVEELETAIRAHRDNFPADDDPSDADLALWRLATPGDVSSDIPNDVHVC